MICTIYKYTNAVNGKVYIGQTWETLNQRARNGGKRYKKCKHFHAAIQKYGWDNFEVETVCLAVDQIDADFWEGHFIRKYDSTNPEKGYNLRTGGSRGKHSKETIERMKSAPNSGRFGNGRDNNMSEDHKAKIGAANKGKPSPRKGKTWTLVNGKRVWS